MPRHSSSERKRDKERSRDREPKRSSRKDSPHEDYEKKSKSSKAYHKDDYHGDDNSSKSSKRDSKHAKDEEYEVSSSNRDNRSGTAEDAGEGSSKSRKRDRHGSPVRIDNDYHHDKIARTKRTVKNHDVYEAVSEDENDGLMSNDDSKKRDSKKKKSNREDKPSSSEVPKRRVFYDSEDQPSEKEGSKDVKKSKKDRDSDQVDEKTSRKRSASPREKKSKRDDTSKRERERPSEASEEEKQKLRREKAKNFTERLREESPSIIFQFGDGGVSKLSSTELAASDYKKSLAVDPIETTSSSTNEANPASQWVAVTTDTEHLFTKQVVNDRILPQSSSSKSRKSEEAKVSAGSAAKGDHDGDDEIYDPTLPTDDYDIAEDKRSKTPPKTSDKKKKSDEKSARADLYDGIGLEETSEKSKHTDSSSSSDRKRRRKSEERKDDRDKEEREKEDSRRSSSRRKEKEKEKVLDDNLYENEPFSPEYEGDFSRRDSSRSKDNSRSRRSSPSRDSYRSSRGDRGHESRDRDNNQPRHDYKDYHSYSHRRGSGEDESRRDERYPVEDNRGGRDDYSHASRRSRNEDRVPDERSQQSSSRRGEEDRERRESVGSRGADVSVDDKFKHPGSPVDPQYKRRSQRDSYEHHQSGNESKHYRDRSTDSGGSRPHDEANGGSRRYSSGYYRQDNRHESVEVVGYRPPPPEEEGPRSSSGSRHYRDMSPSRRPPSRDGEEETGDLEKLESELKDFGGVSEDGSRMGTSSSGRKRDRSPDDADIDVPNPASLSIYPTNTTPMKMSEFAHLPKQFGWPRVRDERNLSGVRGMSQHKSQKEAFSAEAIMSKYNLKKNLTASSLSGSSGGAPLFTNCYDKFRGLNNLLCDLSSREFATGSKADLKLREEIQNCASLSLTVSATHPMFKTFKSLSKSFLVKNYEVDAK